MSEEQSKPKKFRQTRELVKIALDAGMTQDEIAKGCRVSQPTVSNWLNGKSKATEQQLKPLLERFGSRLRRETSRTYLLDPKPGARRPEIALRVVQGRIILRHVFAHPMLRGDIPQDLVDSIARKRPGRVLYFTPTTRWIVHEVPGSLFVLVRQTRRSYSPETRIKWANGFSDSRIVYAELDRDPWLRCADDSARWYSTIDDPRSVGALLDFVDKYAFENEDDALTVRFLLRKALHEHGHTFPGLANQTTPE